MCRKSYCSLLCQESLQLGRAASPSHVLACPVYWRVMLDLHRETLRPVEDRNDALLWCSHCQKSPRPRVPASVSAAWCFALQLLEILVCLPSPCPHRLFLLMLSPHFQSRAHFRIRTELLESWLYSAVFLKLLYNDFGFPKLFKFN